MIIFLEIYPIVNAKRGFDNVHPCCVPVDDLTVSPLVVKRWASRSYSQNTRFSSSGQYEAVRRSIKITIHGIKRICKVEQYYYLSENLRLRYQLPHCMNTNLVASLHHTYLRILNMSTNQCTNLGTICSF